MLTRAVRRRQNLRLARHAADQVHVQLSLPWLCPALWSSHTTYTTTRSNHRPIARRPSISRCQSAACLSTNSRKLASAAPSPSILDSSRDSFPFEYPPSRPIPPRSQTQPYPLQPLAPDLSQILMIDSTTANGPSSFDRVPRGQIRGNAWEIEATLEACLQIHKWDRAFTILKQLTELNAGHHDQLQQLYNKFLEAMVYDHMWNRTSDNIARINGWVENDMKKAGVKPDAHTFALKIKAAISTLTGKRRDRTVRRYWDMAKEYGVDWEVASLREILSDSDLGKLSEISPLEREVEINAGEEVGLEENTIAVESELVSKAAIPPVRETEQKGLGMTSLRKSLSLFNDASHQAEWHSVRNSEAGVREAYARQRQLQLEQDSLNSAAERWNTEHEKLMQMGIAGDLKYGKIGASLWKWHTDLTAAIEAELEKVALAESSKATGEGARLRTEYGPFLRLMDPKTLAALTSTSVVQIMTKFGVESPVKLVRLVTDVGRTVELEFDVLASKQQKAMRKGAPNQQRRSRPRVHWSSAQHAKVGSILCELLFDVAKISSVHESADGKKHHNQHLAFDRKIQYVNGKRISTVVMHRELVKLLTEEPVADILAKQLPMVCKPEPWTAYDQGGYLEAKNSVLRIKNVDTSQKDYTRAAAERGDLDLLFKGLDVLGQTGWQINQDVFNVMLDAWNSGEAIANLPPAHKVLPDVPEPSKDASPREKYNHYKALQDMKNEKEGLHSNRCFMNFQMEIAKALTSETFYLPHNVDFRGRAYPIPPYLNQMGADNARGLLMFAQGRPLGEKGLKWMKVHLANVCGYDKASLTDRAAFADMHMDDVRDSVNNPLNGRRWWLEAEDPWQCLATCHDLVKAIDSGNPEAYISHLPIHQDGTCNGLQHYAALGGDIAGARQVNLEPGDKPADVYSGVCELVKAEVKKDAEAGNSLAKELDGRITRKIVKQTVMTNVYGVTFTGARLQVRKQLDDLLPDLNEKKIAALASTYIARKIFKGLGTLFEGAHEIQYWFGDCANRITSSISPAQLAELSSKPPSKEKNRKLKERTLAERQMVEQGDFRSTVVWTTPLKLPVVQPYRISRAQTIKTHMAAISLMEPNVTDCVDKRKQLQGFPPNFVHSLDATHMMLSAIEAHRLGLTFSAVHDSFWTHASDIDTLNTLLRDAFIRMHAEDVVGRLAEEFRLRYKGHLYLAKVSSSSPLAQQVLNWRQSQKQKTQNQSTPSKSQKSAHSSMDKRLAFQELKLEHKRQTLLSSSDPHEVQKGRSMTTPASLFEAADGEQYLKTRNSLGETAMGKVPESQQDAETDMIKEALSNNEIDEIQDIDMESTLEPILSSEHGSSRSSSQAKSGVTTEHDANSSTRKHGKSVSTKHTSKGRSETNDKDNNTSNRNPGVWLWLPLTFKDVPKKGDWNVERLRESVYFFS